MCIGMIIKSDRRKLTIKYPSPGFSITQVPFMSLRKLTLGIVLGLLCVAAFMLMTDNATATSSGPITIDGNAAMASYASAHSLAGDGTYGNSYVIDGLNINANQADNGIVIKNVDVFVVIQNCVVNNTHNANYNIGSGDGIFISSCDHTALYFNHVHGTYGGITVLNSQDIVVYHNSVDNVTMAGIKLAGCTMCEVYQNFCADSYYGVSSLMSTHGCRVDNNTCLRNFYGLYLSGSYQNILSDNIAKGNTYGISVEVGSTLNKIDLNNCSSNLYSGIFLWANGNTAAGNKVCFNSYSGIQVNQADNSLVIDNLCISNARGIIGTGANFVTLEDNNCSRNTQYGINTNSCQNISTNANKVFASGDTGVYLSQCKNSYLWYDVVGLSTNYGFFVSQSSWIYTTASCSNNGVNGFNFVNCNNCTVSSAHALNNVQNGVTFDTCHLCRVIDSNVMSNQQIGVFSLNSDYTTVQRVNAYFNARGVELDYSSHANITECQMLGGLYSVWIYNSGWAHVDDNEFSGGASGLYLLGTPGSENCTITDNTISIFTDSGVLLTASKWTTIQGNTFSECGYGVKMTGITHIIVQSNEFEEGAYGVYMSSSSLCMVQSNVFNSITSYGIYANSCVSDYFQTNTFEDGPNGIYLNLCSGCLLSANECDASGYGIYLVDTTGTTVSSGRCNDSTGGSGSIGIYVKRGSGLYIQNVNLTQCNIGLKMESSASDFVTGNILLSNRNFGVTLADCTGVQLNHNQFLFNHGSTNTFDISHFQAYDNNHTDSNHWNTSGANGIGNFWSDWCYPDVNRDGIVDSSFFIMGGGNDYLPIADTSEPVATITSPDHDGAVFTNSLVSLSWSATDTWSGLDHYEIYMDSGPWLQVGFGNLQIFNLVDGQHHLHVKAVDKAGNEGTTVRMFYVDTAPPVATITAPGNHTAIDDNTPTIEWTGSDSGTGIVNYNISWDLGQFIPVGNALYYTVGSPLSQGPHTFYLMASDVSGHSSVYSIDVYVDTAAPILDSVSPSNNDTMHAKDVLVSWHAYDLASSPSGLDRTEVKMDTGQWLNEQLLSSYTFLNVPEGAHTIYVRAFDKAGNMVGQSAVIMVDYSLPTISILTPSNHTTYSVDSLHVSWAGADTGSGIASYYIGVDNGPMSCVGTDTDWTFLGLGEGSHDLKVMAVDHSGNSRVAFINVMIDITAPTVSIVTPTQGGFYFSPGVNVTWTSMEFGSGISSYDVRVDDGPWQSSGTSRFSLLQMSEGVHMISVRASDLAGNSRSASVNITLDLNPPVIHSMTPASGSLVNRSTVVFGWNASDAIGITYVMYSIDSDAGHGLMAGVDSASGTLSQGIHTFKLTVRDRDGREAIGYVNLTVDTLAPTVAAHTPATPNTGVSGKVSFRFSEPVDIALTSCKVNGLETDFTSNGTNYDVSKTLTAGTTYNVTITGAKDLAGNVMQPFSWTFSVVSGEQAPGQFVVSGTMVDKNGHGVAGAAVTIGGQSTTANDQGQFSFYVDRGLQQMHVSATGMVDYSQTVNVTSDMQMGQVQMTSLADGGTPGVANPNGGDMTPFLVIGFLAISGAIVAVIILRRRKG